MTSNMKKAGLKSTGEDDEAPEYYQLLQKAVEFVNRKIENGEIERETKYNVSKIRTVLMRTLAQEHTELYWRMMKEKIQSPELLKKILNYALMGSARTKAEETAFEMTWDRPMQGWKKPRNDVAMKTMWYPVEHETVPLTYTYEKEVTAMGNCRLCYRIMGLGDQCRQCQNGYGVSYWFSDSKFGNWINTVANPVRLVQMLNPDCPLENVVKYHLQEERSDDKASLLLTEEQKKYRNEVGTTGFNYNRKNYFKEKFMIDVWLFRVMQCAVGPIQIGLWADETEFRFEDIEAMVFNYMDTPECRAYYRQFGGYEVNDPEIYQKWRSDTEAEMKYANTEDGVLGMLLGKEYKKEQVQIYDRKRQREEDEDSDFDF